MDIRIENYPDKPHLTILRLEGDLDGASYQDVIQAAQQAQQAGSTHLLLDMAAVPFMGSAGLVALHSIALLMQGKALPDANDGWGALHALGDAGTNGAQPYVKLLNPQASVNRGLQKTGMARFFDIYSDQDAALDSF